MAQQLKTVEDFERVAKAFEDPSAEPYQYQVRDFGYCTQCRKVVEYEINHLGEKKLCFENCISGHHGQSESITGDRRPPGLILRDDDVPVSVKEEVDWRLSREVQKECFAEIVAQKIKELGKKGVELEIETEETGEFRRTLMRGLSGDINYHDKGWEHWK